MVDNGRYLRRKSQTFPFKVIFSSNKGYFEAQSIAKQFRTGYETIFEIQPIEVAATQDLHKVDIEARKCKFSDEAAPESIFKNYSHNACKFECKIKFAEDKCHCTPWNIPPSSDSPTICDLYGNTCFHDMMEEPTVLKVRKSQKENVMSSIFPKNQRKNFPYFCHGI